MKPTGVIRRIDELGRIVIPKEIRRNLKIRDGESMEIFINDDSIILKKYSRLEDSIIYIDNLVNKISELTGLNIIITDREKVISSTKDLNINNEMISDTLIKLIDKRLTLKESESQSLNINDKSKLDGYSFINPLIDISDSIGLVIINSREPLSNNNLVIAEIIKLIIIQSIAIN